MAGVSSKNKRKLSEENRMFQENWEEEYFVVPNKKGSATCLILLCQWRYHKMQLSQLHHTKFVTYSFIELKNDTHLEVIFKEKREQKEYFEFWNLVPGKYKTIQKCAHFLLTMFTSTFLCETSYSKMKYAKNVYRNRLTDSHLDDLLRVACSKYKPDLSKIVKELSQYQNSH
ncbi:uncharacterized protein LOC112691116 [Sipha flava]|uniref:Uncharacterized protein LOC112691116 n=1 Tax=Sipha flava TaxID=143950 RepID=A0A8B8GE02_9HEMI|nr:uncharacterized protein LOC112691116 [Sipha flava]